ncbi:SusC/RagA family TonB-linked outer membrane protein [Arcticibacter eurypsychrophilus]|uniref:SusC/RagA family TonB-linked outer membrane protein n=1 Tax=Arcticibacter eurypsychrophilus TaxID=1434752 RepID=UPI00084D206D|nr:TonB-dependent receptor [Arcticibacter eurypsychrophilus]
MERIATKKDRKVLLWMLLSMMLFSLQGFAQTRTITGKVTAISDAQPIPSAAVKIKGKTGGTSTNVEGVYSISAQTGDLLEITSIGFAKKEVRVGQGNTINIQLSDDVKALDEVVVIGYGVQRKRLVTGATAQVKGDELQKQSTTNALQALQGQAPGIQISSTSGQPGEGSRVIIRGVGTVSNSGPLYIVDGVQTPSIDYLNPSDIESLDVLKDAASAAIYGSQAANGVVLVTTRQGKKGQAAQITIDAYTGTQSAAKKAKLLNSQQYASIMNEAAVNGGKTPYFTNAQIAEMGSGTNWLDEMFVDNALTQNYVVGAQGGSESSVYSTSLSYTGQEGIVGGKDLSNYDRYNFRINSEHNLYNKIVTVGQHLTFNYINSNGIGVGNQYSNSLRAAFNTSPFVPMYDENGNFFDNSKSTWNNGEANPYAAMVYGNQNARNNQRMIGDLYFQIEPIKNLKFRTSLGIDYFAEESRSFSPIYTLSIYSFNNISRVDQSLGKGKTLMLDKLLSYNFNVNKDHKFELLAGTSSFHSDRSAIWGANSDLIFNDLEHAWLSNATNTNGATIAIGGGPTDRSETVFEEKRMSYFGRLNYNYKETYLLNTTFRADGSSKFYKSNRWGYFPSVSAGWVLSNEEFLKSEGSLLSFLKLRASWGQVGNQNIAAFQYLAPVRFNNVNYSFGDKEGALTPGAFPNRLGNPDVKWETSEQLNIGLDARLLHDKIGVTVDWYKKATKDWLIAAPIYATAGAEAPYINGGNVENRGIELGLTYNGTSGDFRYSIGVNGAYNKNEVKEIPNPDETIPGALNQLFDNSARFYRAQTGFPIGYFWGLTTAGIFQTEADVNANRSSNGTLIQPSAQPGDVRYADLNDDGVINDLDRGKIGDPNPDYTFGITLSANYKGLDFSMLASGVAGNQIVQSYRNQTNQYANYTTAILGRWHGEGTSNTLPRVTENSSNWINFSDLYIHKGDYLRISNVTLGYDFGKVIKKGYLRQVRIYGSVQNLYTFTTYTGMDPEIGYGIDNGERDRFSSGIDLGYYPRPRTFLLGANIRF